jgi:hypothetical protein
VGTELLAVLAVIAALGYWLNGMRTKEIARLGGRRACREANVYFLDDTVAQTRLRLRRDGRGRFAIYREYRFEFTSDGTARYRGEMVVCGKQIRRITMEPYRVSSTQSNPLH